MSAAVGVRDDYDALTLRGLSRTSEDLRQARRLLSLACVHDGMSRADAAKGGGRDRVHRFNEAGPEGLFDRRVPRPRWLNLLRSSNPAPALSLTLEPDGGSAGDDLTCNGGAKTGSVLFLTRGPSPGCLQRPAFPASPGARNTRPNTRASWRLSKKRPPKPCLPFEPRSGRQADRGPGSGRGPHRPEDRPRPHPGAQGDETAMAGRSALQTGLPVRRGVRRQGDRRSPDAAMLPCCHAAIVLWADTETRNLPLKEISRTVAKGVEESLKSMQHYLPSKKPAH